MKWQTKVKTDFLDNYAEISGMPLLSFKSSGSEKYKILLLGPEQGNMPFCSKALLYTAKSFNIRKPENTLFDILPVIDVKGYPSKNSGEPLDASLLSIFANYNMVVQVTSFFREEWPYCNGYFAVPQVQCNELPEGRKQIVIKPATKDLVGTIVNYVRSAGFSLQTLNDEGFVGDRYVMASEGILLPASKCDGYISIGTRNAIALECQKLGVESVMLATTASKHSKNKESLDSHKAALEAVIRIYEGKKN